MPDTLIMEFTDEGTCSTPWWTKDLEEIMAEIGEASDELMRDLNSNPYCG
jgi:hypothetical protein